MSTTFTSAFVSTFDFASVFFCNDCSLLRRLKSSIDWVGLRASVKVAGTVKVRLDIGSDVSCNGFDVMGKNTFPGKLPFCQRRMLLHHSATHSIENRLASRIPFPRLKCHHAPNQASWAAEDDYPPSEVLHIFYGYKSIRMKSIKAFNFIQEDKFSIDTYRSQVVPANQFFDQRCCNGRRLLKNGLLVTFAFLKKICI